MKLVSDLEKAKIKQNNKLNSSSTDDDTTAQLDFQRKRLKCLFERAISHDSNCLDVSLWLKYIHYLVKITMKRTIKTYLLMLFNKIE